MALTTLEKGGDGYAYIKKGDYVTLLKWGCDKSIKRWDIQL